jgi:hypothetical protein
MYNYVRGENHTIHLSGIARRLTQKQTVAYERG